MSYDGDHDHDGQMELGNIQVSVFVLLGQAKYLVDVNGG
jgi:hypothetical protein